MLALKKNVRCSEASSVLADHKVDPDFEVEGVDISVENVMQERAVTYEMSAAYVKA
jgi:hypothetical protein